jgi:5-dehydro-2-deoxygluconokinase
VILPVQPPGASAGVWTPEVLTVGRVGVDLYPSVDGHPEHVGAPLTAVRTFDRFLGGTATNVAVAAARLGHRSAVLTKVGSDPFGDYVRTALAGFGVDPRFVGTASGLLTPVVFCALAPPEDPPLLFYRLPVAPDLTLTADDVPWDTVADVPLLWVTGTGASVEPARSTQLAMLEHRRRRGSPSARWTVLDLDWRPMFWPSPHEAHREYARMLDHVDVVVGNRDEVDVAVGTRDPEEAAHRLLDRGLELVLVKKGGEGVLVATPDATITVPPRRVDVVNGLGAGDAFGGALCHGLLAGWDHLSTARLANAAGALVASRLACADAMPTLAELGDAGQPAPAKPSQPPALSELERPAPVGGEGR